MKKSFIYTIGFIILFIFSCSQDNRFGIDVEIPNFNFPKSVIFEQNLSFYNIFEGNKADLIPSTDFHLLELSSVLYTDYAHKQRLVKIPEGTEMLKLDDGSIEFPDGTILVKTFFYYNDERNVDLGKRIIESRLLIKEDDVWNVATYQWNDTQDDAILELNGKDTPISWINSDGENISTMYHIPDENECISCHQSNSTMIPLGTKLRNLNRLVERNGQDINQLNHLQSLGILNSFQVSEITQIENYNNLNLSLEERGRAYLEMNCAHCHNPQAWEAAAEQDLDFRYETPLNETGILSERNRIKNLMSEGEMPLIGTTIIDEEGVDLITDFIDSL